jgi:hypothetical protein
MPDYIPDPDAAFEAWSYQFCTFAGANLVALGIVAGDLIPVTTAQAIWQAEFQDHLTAQAAAQNARQRKDNAREVFESAIRALVIRLQASPSVSDGERAGLGITVPDAINTPIGAPTSRPILAVDTSQRLRHTIAFSDEATPNSRAKPDGARGCEIFVKLGGAAPLDLSECTYLATDTRTPYVTEFDGSDANKLAHYIGRWVSTRGEPGPISETVSATVGG